MKIAITGGTGFIGRNLVPRLLERGNELILVTRSPEMMGNPGRGCKLVKMDLAEASDLTYELLGKPDCLLHLAWDGLPNYRSLRHIEEQLPLSYEFIKCLVRSGLDSVVAAGTCMEYGMQNGPLHEDMLTIPDTPYGFAKNSLRIQLEFLKSEYPFSFTWMRLFYLYGVGQPESTIFSQLKTAAEREQKRFLMSRGEQLRDYLHISEAIDYISKLVMQRKNHGIVNISSGQPISIRSLTEKWIEDYGWDIELELGHYPYPDYEPMAFWGRREKLDKILKESC